MWGLKKLAEQLNEQAKYLAVIAEVRYWEDASINGVEDSEGKMPKRSGGNWMPVIRLEDGKVCAWPDGVTAQINYNVCDAGEYFLLDSEGERIAKLASDYVPTMLAIDEVGFGNYIILTVQEDGIIKDWEKPKLAPGDWNDIE